MNNIICEWAIDFEIPSKTLEFILKIKENKKITKLTLDEEKGVRFEFEDGTNIRLFDDLHRCCESRFMSTDDDLSYFIGSELLNAEVRETRCKRVEMDEMNEEAFLVITTSNGDFTVVTHNEHNGYYGGFSIAVAANENSN